MHLVIDQGGHASRASVYDGSGQRLGFAEVPVSTSRPAPGRVEQDPGELLDSVWRAIAGAMSSAGADPRDIENAGLAVQRSNVVCWERPGGMPLSPALSWQDLRGIGVVELDSALKREILQRTGLPASPHYGAFKLRWCIDRLDAVRDAVECGRLVCGPLASFLAAGLLRHRPQIADPATAGRTLLWNLETLDWDTVLPERFGIPRNCLPRAVPGLARHGEFETVLAGVPLEVLIGDQNAVVYASGRPSPETVYVNTGTGAFALRIVEAGAAVARGLLPGVASSDGLSVERLVEGTVNGAGAGLEWFANASGIDDLETRLPGWLDSEHEPPLFLNGVSGLGSPWWRTDLEPRFVGEGGPAARAVAVVESVAFLLQVNLDLLRRHGDAVRRVRIGGGIARLDGLCRRLAAISGLPVERPGETEATSLGVAFLLAGKPRRWPDPEPTSRFDPIEDAGLRRRYERWRDALAETLERSRRG